MQEKCCGAYNYSDYKKVGWSQLINATDSPISAIVPVSCCTKKKNNTVTGDTPTSLNDFENLQECLIGVEDYINLKVFEFTALTLRVTSCHMMKKNVQM